MKPLTVRELYEHDRTVYTGLSMPQARTYTDKNTGYTATIDFVEELDQKSNSKYFRIFIPKVGDRFELIVTSFVAPMISGSWKHPHLISVNFESTTPGDLQTHAASEMVFTKIVYIYHEDDWPTDRLIAIRESARTQLDIKIVFRGIGFAEEASKYLKPTSFICHDSRDKERFVSPFVRELRSLGGSIWYDEFNIQPGDSIRKSIEKGLKESHTCVLVLSRNFIANSSWADFEFESVFQKHLYNKAYRLIPIWVDVSKEEVREFNLWISGILAVVPNSPEEAARNLVHLIAQPLASE